ncbi:tetratricopeptide repeat protein [Thioalkalivibrio halophilus]|uniref:Sel1 repeat family protein n=1 Tax=Thioalkalivibrio halophilus TaxID=252474 RepID=A0A1V3A1F0_9GAMM|nr:tetratricopeptide repeat protein [Thioalkalivibrio halophilus]OOC11172.1 hypothetical protein B1A74_01925 [Thioalkalivibrio halophilus]
MTHSDDDTAMALRSGIAAFEAREFSRAMGLLLPLAESGHPEAQYRVAIMHQTGLAGVARPDAAFHWMRAAAEQGDPLAQHGLGFMFLSGECVKQDPQQAVLWLERAARQGLAGSRTTLAMLYARGEGVDPDPEAARYWYAQAGFDPDELELLDG